MTIQPQSPFMLIYNVCLITTVALAAMTLVGDTAACPVPGKDVDVPDYTTAEAGNPFVDGWYADPDTAVYNGEYWVFPTASLAYDDQTYLDAFSSPDLINWTKHPKILTIENVKWAKRAVWAPAPVSRNGKYYLYFGANDIQEGEPEAGAIGGIGVAVADKPEGPYVDAIGKTLIGDYHNGAQPIDQDVFVDDDGQAYIYYGGHSHANVAKINEDMVSIGTFDDNTTFKEITPENYVEGSQMLKRNGVYYFMWSEGGWTGPDYSVSYAMSDSPLGPFQRVAKILQQDPAVAKGSGHHGVINVPGTDIYYIVYHRRPLSETDGNHRILAYDRMYFNADGTIAPVKMLLKDNFVDGNMIGWKIIGDKDDWYVVDQRLTVSPSRSSWAAAVLDTNFADLVFDATASVGETPMENSPSGFAGLIFRATNLTSGEGHYSFVGYVVYISISRGSLVLGKIDDDELIILEEVLIEVVPDVEYHLIVKAIGDIIEIFMEDNVESAIITSTDSTFITGATGLVASRTKAKFGSVSVAHPE